MAHIVVFGGGFQITISFFTISVCSSFYLAVFFPVGFLRNLNSFGPITLDNITVSFLTTLVYSSFYIPAFSRLVFKKSQFDYS